MTSRSLVPVGAALLATLAVAACSRGDVATAPGTGGPNAAAATQFNLMGDSVLAAGGSASDAAPFYGAAGVIGQTPNIATISVGVDGVETQMNAVAVAVQIFGGVMIACPVPPVGAGAAAPFVCPWGIPRLTRTLFAWTPDKPTRIVTLVASSDSGAIGTPIPFAVPGSGSAAGVGTSPGASVDSATGLASALARPIPAHLEYRDGKRVWWGISGTQTNTVKVAGGSCPPPPTSRASAPRPAAMPAAKCQLAAFTFAFEGTVARPPVALFGNANLDGTHTLNMGLTQLTGVHLSLLTP